MATATLESTLPAPPPWQTAFDAILPGIMHLARFALRSVPRHSRDEALQDVVANCCVAFSRLVARGKADQAFPSALVRFAVSQYRTGRRVGNRLSSGDVLSQYAQFHWRFQLESLNRRDPASGEWQEALYEDRKTCVADQAAFRIDFPAWLEQLPARDRYVAEALSVGEPMTDVAKRFGLSPGRVSQLRGELCRSWQRFHDRSAVG